MTKLQRKRVGEPPVPNTRTFDVSRAQMFVKICCNSLRLGFLLWFWRNKLLSSSLSSSCGIWACRTGRAPHSWMGTEVVQDEEHPRAGPADPALPNSCFLPVFPSWLLQTCYPRSGTLIVLYSTQGAPAAAPGGPSQDIAGSWISSSSSRFRA